MALNYTGRAAHRDRCFYPRNDRTAHRCHLLTGSALLQEVHSATRIVRLIPFHEILEPASKLEEILAVCEAF